MTDDDSAVSTLLVRAGGQGAVGQPPLFEVLVDGQSLGTRAVSDPVQGSFARNNDALYDDFVFNLAAAPTSTVEVMFFNDGNQGGQDRNLFIDFIEIDGVVIEVETGGVVIPDNPNSPLGGSREDMLVNATMLFDDLAIV